MNGRSGADRRLIAIALAAAFAPAQAVEPVAPQNIEPVAPAAMNTAASSASIGAGYASHDARRFGQYNGINEDGFYGLLDFNWVRRDEQTGTWTRIFGRDVGLESRQLRFEQQRQGNWGYSLDYSRIPRFEPLMAVTAVGGIGSDTLTIPATLTTGGPTELKTRRDIFGLGLEKAFAGNWDVQLSFRNEEKEGTRIFARGTTGTTGVTIPPAFGTFEFAPEPINATTRQLEAKVNYNGGALLLTGGYYGTMYNNSFDSGLHFTGGNAALSTFTPIALPPDNQSHQFYVSGNYSFSANTRSTFKLAYAKATQDASFVSGPNVPLAPGVGDNLNGRVDTKLAQFGLTSRPMPRLSVVADFRLEDRDDKTPVLVYGPTTNSTWNGENEPRSIKTTTARAEANYALPEGFRVIGGVGWEEKERNISAIRIVSARETTEETTWRVELRRAMSETVTGSLALMRSDRGGSPFQTTVIQGGAPGSNLIAPVHLADRERDKIRLSVNWQPTNPLTVQFIGDKARDEYSGRDDPRLGPRKGEASFFSVDAAYTFSERWQANAWYSRNDTSFDHAACEAATGNPAACPATAADPVWAASLRNLATSLGFGMRGRTGPFDIGADFSYSDIRDESHLDAVAGTGAVVNSLPDIRTKLQRVNVFGRYALQKNSGVRLDLVFERFETDDWTWPTWAYADGTRLQENPVQKASFVGASYYYRFQ